MSYLHKLHFNMKREYALWPYYDEEYTTQRKMHMLMQMYTMKCGWNEDNTMKMNMHVTCFLNEHVQYFYTGLIP